MEYKDYYKLLGVTKSSTTEEISKAFKKLARKYHPDLNPNDPQAESKFKDINEAYEVLKDPEKRKLYDSLGPNWKDGQNFQPPPGFDKSHFHFGGAGGQGFDAGAFSDFFETIFGGGFGGAGGPRGAKFRSSNEFGGYGDAGFGGFGGAGGFSQRPRRGTDANAGLELTLEEAYRGGSKAITLQEQVTGPDGRPQMSTKTLNVNIPPGIKDGAKIRLSGQGNPGMSGGTSGDLYLKIRILPHHLFKLEEGNVILDLPLAPWEAALGAKVEIPTLDGRIEMNIPAGLGSGKKLRIRGKGLGPKSNPADQYVRIMIQTPKDLTDEERELWTKLSELSHFEPRNF